MQHVHVCDECGDTFETYCFGSGTGEIFYEPAMPDRDYSVNEMDEYLKDICSRKIIRLCAKHAEEYHAKV